MCDRLVLYGCGKIGMEWLERLGAEKVYAFADSDKEKIGKTIAGKNVLSIADLVKMKDEVRIYISTSDRYKHEICKILADAALKGKIVDSPYKDVWIAKTAKVDDETVFEGRNAVTDDVILSSCKLGYASYVAVCTKLYKVKIGRYSSIGPNVRIVRGQHPTRQFVSTCPIFYSTQEILKKSYVSHNIFEEYRYTKDGWSVDIGNDVWIGDEVTIMEGVTVADGTIVAAHANVVKDTEPYSIVGGNPAKIIRYRFDKEDIEFLKRLQWWNKSKIWVDEHAKYFNDIKKFISIVKAERS